MPRGSRGLHAIPNVRVDRMSGPGFQLQTILETIKRSPPGECLAVFDLDSTLYDLTLRVSAIIDRFAKSPGARARFPEACARLADVEIRRTDWGLREPLGRIGITSSQYPEFVNEIQAAWALGFFSNDFLAHDFPLPGAVAFVEHCLAAGSEVLYLTGRDTPRMGAGTEMSLKQCGFPLDGVKSRLHLKPDAANDDAQFKADVIDELSRRYPQIWLFENEPVNINAVLKRTPQVEIIFIDTCHSGQEEVMKTFATIQQFAGHFTAVPISDLE